MVRVVRVQLAEVAALVGHADVGQRDAHQPRREQNHLEAVVLQRCGAARGEERNKGNRRKEWREMMEVGEIEKDDRKGKI